MIIRCDKHASATVDYDKDVHGGCPLCQSMRLEGAMSKRVEELKKVLCEMERCRAAPEWGDEIRRVIGEGT